MKRALIVFVKNPKIGQVKTRLAKDIGDENALNVYHTLLQKTQEITASVKASKFIFYSDFITTNDWPRTYFRQIQEGQDLGQKMQNAFKEIIGRGYDQTIIIGSDCYQLSAEIIEEAFDLLNDMDCVLGPALDGGYYLLGMNTFHPELFENIEWSTENVLEQTIRKISAKELNYQRTQLLSDIDTLEDLKRTDIYENIHRNNEERI